MALPLLAHTASRGRLVPSTPAACLGGRAMVLGIYSHQLLASPRLASGTLMLSLAVQSSTFLHGSLNPGPSTTTEAVPSRTVSPEGIELYQAAWSLSCSPRPLYTVKTSTTWVTPNTVPSSAAVTRCSFDPLWTTAFVCCP